jgi:adenylate cyclase
MSQPATWPEIVRSLLGEPELTPVDVAREAQVDREVARRFWQALGFPPVPDDHRVFTRSDVAMLRAACAILGQGSAESPLPLQLTRVAGQSLARLAEAQVSAMVERLEPAAPRLDEIVHLIEPLTPALEKLLAYVWRRHLVAALLRRGADVFAPPTSAHATAVGFADIVGFTAASQQLDMAELAAMVDRFEALAYERILDRGGRVVKMIGDEVMFAADEVVAAAEIGLGLVEAYGAAAGTLEVRVGLAWGPTLSWEGDLFGPVVNLASRLVNLARPATVLASAELGERLGTEPAYVLRHLRAVRLKGVGRVRPWVVRRATGEAPPHPTERARRARR